MPAPDGDYQRFFSGIWDDFSEKSLSENKQKDAQEQKKRARARFSRKLNG